MSVASLCRVRSIRCVVVLLTALAATARAQGDDQVARGRYLAIDVAKCVECHTPRDEDGTLLQDQLFEGAPVPVERPRWATDWALRAPQIAGLPGREGEFIVSVLTTGQRPTGERPRPPMPSFRMTVEDAEALSAYLRSLR